MFLLCENNYSPKNNGFKNKIKTMKVIGISGSPRNQNTYNIIKTILEISGFDYEIIFLKDKNIKPCKDCRKCHKTYKCGIKDDMQNICDKLTKAECIVFGSPTYFHNVSGIFKNYMDRCLPFYLSEKLKGKKAVLVTSGGFENTLEFNKNGKCKWHKKEKEAVKRCLKSMEYFCELLGIEVVDKVYSLHDDYRGYINKAEAVGKKLKKTYAKSKNTTAKSFRRKTIL